MQGSGQYSQRLFGSCCTKWPRPPRKKFQGLGRFQTCLALSQKTREWAMVLTSLSHMGQIELMSIPLLLRFTLVGRAFKKARQAKIQTFAGIFRCQILTLSLYFSRSQFSLDRQLIHIKHLYGKLCATLTGLQVTNKNFFNCY